MKNFEAELTSLLMKFINDALLARCEALKVSLLVHKTRTQIFRYMYMCVCVGICIYSICVMLLA